MSEQSSAPGAWLGLLGGGQLGRMFASAAQRLGFRVVVLDPGTDSPAGRVADRQIVAHYDDQAGLAELASLAQASTTEFENVPAESLRFLAARGVVRPGAASVSIAQDRIAEKEFITGCGIPVAPHVVLRSANDLADLPHSLFPAVIKVSRMGYDGKGQARVVDLEAARQAFAGFGGVPCVIEKLLPLAYEVSSVLARGADGETVSYPMTQNIHRAGILAVSIAPSPVSGPALARQVLEWSKIIVERLDYVGVLCVELFVLVDGTMIVNEIAPRPHNSGHFTMDSCVTSQFEQQVRVLAGLPLGDTRQHSFAVMLNLMGELWFVGDSQGKSEPDWAAVLAIPGAALHLYGKNEPRRGRKMGHVTVTGPTAADADRGAWAVAQHLGIAPWLDGR